MAWQIDPFGHSREMASIFAQIGFDGFFLNRIDYQDHSIRRNSKALEFVWRGSPDNLGESSDIFTNVLFRHYSAPSGLCFDTHCSDEPIIDDPDSPEYNVQSKVRINHKVFCLNLSLSFKRLRALSTTGSNLP